MDYQQIKSQVATLAVVPEDDENFVIVLPAAIEYASLRMQRDLDFLDSTGSVVGLLSSGARRFSLPPGTLVVTEQINLILPAGTVTPDAGERKALLPVSKEYIDAIYGSSSYRGEPEVWCAYDQNNYMVGPFADFSYRCEVVGTVRFEPLSETNTENFLSLYLPDMLIQAMMVYLSAYQRNFGAQSGDPAMAQSYENQYQTLLKSAMTEEARKKWEGAAWSSQGPATIATPTRG